MTLPRRQLVNADYTRYYHCTVRCVRRAYLCGEDRISGQNFDHRRQWLEDRLATLNEIFAIELLAYAIMSNHYHVVVRLDPDASVDWSEDEVIERWRTVFPQASQVPDPDTVALWRARLTDLSWYMRSVNEPMARRANREDGCTGRFWEGRFRSQALLDDQALLKCMAYVDLNPIRAGLAMTPESSAHTSIQARINRRDAHLARFATTQSIGSIPCQQQDYLHLVDWTGRLIRGDKHGAIPPGAPPILSRLAKDSRSWKREMRHYGRWYYVAVGSLDALRKHSERLGQRWLRGMRIVENSFV